ncbi:sulfite exporter TauE/SafE family protein [Roseisalinus antarcticus]|uniref:Probable membrane transporter protein n=1 Tax=Roseisalinus antarcticus TaxID=254357 RepID=A0A1Y5TYK4_9RHOB|nr:sulfite exporter TauE/SafE family protein [Roseisalinus antarcticus]SLN76758.1 Sulfite exporter TauE/SafE [Roseisalinus antarcticus]
MELIATLTDGITLQIVIALLIAGGCIGVLAGIFGVGGGAISVPVFFETFRAMGVTDDVAMPLAVGTSLAMIIPTSILSARTHARKGTVDMGIVKAWILPVLLGVALGSVIARYASPVIFQAVFVLVAGTNAVKLLFGTAGWKLGDTMPGRAGTSAYGAVVGLLSALMGIGGGAISNLILTLNGKDVREAVSTSAAVGVIIAIPGTVGYILAGWGQAGLPPDAVGFVSVLALVLTLPTALLTTRAGVALAHVMPQKLLGRLFGIFLLLVSLRFLAEIFL